MEANRLEDFFEFRTIKVDEADQAVAIEHICFPPNEACSREKMTERATKAPEVFLVAVDRETGKLAALLNGIFTDEETFRDEFFLDITLHNPKGKHVMIVGLDVLPEYRGRGMARELMERYVKRERANGRTKLILTCLDEKVAMYKKMGFQDDGIANSEWGGEEWHQMTRVISE